MKKMFTITTEPSCDLCKKCEEHLPGFISKHGGTISVSVSRFADDLEMQVRVHRARKCCLNNSLVVME